MTSASAELRAALGVSALLRRRPADLAGFRRLVSGNGPFAAVTGLCLLLADGDGRAMAARDFVGVFAPGLLQQLRRETRVEREVMHGRTRGRVDWSSTYKERYATDGNPTLFVCLPGWRQYDLPENQLVKAVLLALQRAVAAVPPELGAWRAWGPGAPRRADGAPPTVAAVLDPLRFQLKKLLGMMALRDVAEPPAIDIRHLAAARGSKNELYGLVADFHDYVRDAGGDNWDRWARTVSSILPLLPGDAVSTRVGQMAEPAHGGMMSETHARANGILADTGEYGLEATVGEIYASIVKERQHRTAGEKTVEGTALTKGTQGLADERDLEEARWALIVPDPMTPAVQTHLDHLKPLIALRAGQMKEEPPVLSCPAGLRFDTFVAQVAKLQFGEFDPAKLPYYLCIVAPPDDPALGWAFQQNLDAPYAVGRIWFDDPQDCKSYVERLVAREKAGAKSDRATLFVSPVFPGDDATANSHAHFVVALRNWASGQAWAKGISLDLLDPVAPHAPARRKELSERLAAQRPALLFAASHGVERKPADPADQGALLLQDWPGPKNPIQPGHFLSESDLPADLDGMMAFCFACHSAGAPKYPDWIHPSANANPAPLAAKPFIARLPQKMLARGAPAFIGHVSKAWDYSFLSIDKIDGAWLQTLSAYKSALRLLLAGYPAGHATDALNGRWLTLTQLLDDAIAHGAPQADVVSRWMARNDCRGYVVLGDPFARLNA